MKENEFEIIRLDKNGDCETTAWFLNKENTTYNLVTYVMLNVLHNGNIWDEHQRQRVMDKFKFHENERNTFVEVAPDTYYFCWLRS